MSKYEEMFKEIVASGKTIAEYCRSKDVNPKYIRLWKYNNKEKANEIIQSQEKSKIIEVNNTLEPTENKLLENKKDLIYEIGIDSHILKIKSSDEALLKTILEVLFHV